MQRGRLGLMLGWLFGMNAGAAGVPTDEELLRAAERHVEELVKQKREAKAEAERRAEAAKQAEAARAAELERLLTTLRDLLWVKGGAFQMGSPADEKDRGSDERQHQVTVKDFFIGKYEVTQAQWRAVMGDNPSNFKGCDACPVERVSWNEVQEFLAKLNARTGQSLSAADRGRVGVCLPQRGQGRAVLWRRGARPAGLAFKEQRGPDPPGGSEGAQWAKDL
jgi:hypothetical protein